MLPVFYYTFSFSSSFSLILPNIYTEFRHTQFWGLILLSFCKLCKTFLTHLRWSHSLQYQQPQWWSLTKIPLLVPCIMYRKYIFLIFIVEMLSRPTKILCTAMTTVFSSQTYRKVTQNDMESNGNYYLFFINVSVTRSWSRRMPLIFKTELFCFYCTHRNSFVQLTSLCLLYTRKKTTGQIILNTY